MKKEKGDKLKDAAMMLEADGRPTSVVLAQAYALIDIAWSLRVLVAMEAGVDITPNHDSMRWEGEDEANG